MQLLKKCVGKDVPQGGQGPREVHNNLAKNERFVSNFIKTSKYELWNFVPANLYYQFGRVANCYFLFNMCISLVPGVSPINPITAILPLVFVLGVAAVKDGYEDWQRHKDDSKWNSAPGQTDGGGRALSGVVRNGVVDASVPSRDVRVGDIVKMVRDEYVRADTLLLSSSDDKEHSCFIETMQLDGETNAKLRQAAQTTVGNSTHNLTGTLVSPDAFTNANITVSCVGPGPDLHEWTGKLSFNDRSEGVNISQFLYRGCKIVNTQWVYGIIIYTGVDTKMQRNNVPKPAKKSKLDEKLNKMIATVLVLQHIIIFTMCALSVVFKTDNEGEKWYIDYYLGYYEGVVLFFMRYMTYFILMSFMIPISLFVTIEITKAFQAKFMQWDLKMRTWLRDANNATIGDAAMGCNPRTSNLNEQLAIVKYIFSDKTGTLTENRMQFHTGEIGNPEHTEPGKCGRNFSDAPPEDRDKPGKDEGDIKKYLTEKKKEGKLRPPGASADGGRSRSHVENVLWYMMNLAMCHELSILAADGEDGEPVADAAGPRNYQGASPDEVALAKCAQYNGIEFRARTSGSITIEILGVPYEYRIVDTLPFTSKRKLMSIVLQGPCERGKTGELVDAEGASRFCLTKGADTAVILNAAGGMKRERGGWTAVEEQTVRDPWYQNHYHPRLWNELEKLSGIGLRTLVLAYQPLPSGGKFDAWHEGYAAAKKLVQPEEREKAMEASWAQMESGFFICGATAIEDKLQEQVPQTVDFLLRAGVVVWMLTGDKQETAETIAGTARLVDKQTWDLLYISSQVPGRYGHDVSLDAAVVKQRASQRSAWLCGLARSEHGARTVQPADAFQEGQSVGQGDFLPKALARAEQCRQTGKKCAVVTDGGTLGVICPPGPGENNTAEADAAVEEMWLRFTDLAQMVNSGILCRLTPEQKGKIVRVFQKTTGQTALAIGDGANDVPMINESFVGVGIMGLEGSQAVLASDYAIPRFKHLKRLLFVHGRFSLYRNSLCVLFSFYKNFVLAIIQVYFSFFCGFSGQTLFDSWLLAMQNFAFTSAPPLFVGIFERDLDEDILEAKPALYMPLRDGLYFDTKQLCMWFGESVWHSILVYWLTFSTMDNDDISGESGRTGGVLMVGALTLTCQICTVLVKLALHIRCWVLVQVLGIAFSFAAFIAFLLVYSSFPPWFLIWLGDASFYRAGFYILGDPKFWLWAVFFIVGVIFTVDMPLLYIQRQYYPSLRDLAQRHSYQQRAAAIERKARQLGRGRGP
eukprot:TRINITY_DN5451_c0_g4_i1.p1 TRINITY_DN5451_c0_g4~~TRINITY_DN5451_c0_g4_i1.p1  ORF type:complete len:1302 (+),score=519.96 TRINITY_DN5451_c0_g4_i1:130-3906(+)